MQVKLKCNPAALPVPRLKATRSIPKPQLPDNIPIIEIPRGAGEQKAVDP